MQKAGEGEEEKRATFIKIILLCNRTVYMCCMDCLYLRVRDVNGMISTLKQNIRIPFW